MHFEISRRQLDAMDRRRPAVIGAHPVQCDGRGLRPTAAGLCLNRAPPRSCDSGLWTAWVRFLPTAAVWSALSSSTASACAVAAMACFLRARPRSIGRCDSLRAPLRACATVTARLVSCRGFLSRDLPKVLSGFAA